jgi:hypothetical protein
MVFGISQKYKLLSLLLLANLKLHFTVEIEDIFLFLKGRIRKMAREMFCNDADNIPKNLERLKSITNITETVSSSVEDKHFYVTRTIKV